jgi:hypothetical protein
MEISCGLCLSDGIYDHSPSAWLGLGLYGPTRDVGSSLQQLFLLDDPNSRRLLDRRTLRRHCDGGAWCNFLRRVCTIRLFHHRSEGYSAHCTASKDSTLAMNHNVGFAIAIAPASSCGNVMVRGRSSDYPYLQPLILISILRLG